MRGWCNVIHEMLFQRILASHLRNPLHLPPVNDITCIVTGSTTGIGQKIARQLAESGAHVVMAVRNLKATQDLIQKLQDEWAGRGLPLNIEVMELDLLSLDSVLRFSEAWNARLGPLHVLINNAGIFSIGEPQKFSKDGRHECCFWEEKIFELTGIHKQQTSTVAIMFSSILQRRLPAESGISAICVPPGIVCTNVARDLSKVVQAGYHLIPYFIFSAQEGSRSTLFAATDPLIPEYCDLLRADDWPVCAFISHDCRPANPSEEAHNIETSHNSDAVERLLEGEEVKCRYGARQE